VPREASKAVNSKANISANLNPNCKGVMLEGKQLSPTVVHSAFGAARTEARPIDEQTAQKFIVRK
jgi:hypothetical protein